MAHIQRSITFWGELVLATGGVLKQNKCQVAIAAYKFKSGKAIIKKPRKARQPSFQQSVLQMTLPLLDSPTTFAILAYTS